MSKSCWLVLFYVIIVLTSCNDGVRKTYWENGNPKSELRYKGDKLNGESVWYTSDGRVMTSAYYQDDTLNGRYQRFYSNGVLEVECWYKNGQRDSIYRS